VSKKEEYLQRRTKGLRIVTDILFWSARDAGPTLVSYVVGKGVGVKPPEQLVASMIFLYNAIRPLNPGYGFNLDDAAPYKHVAEISPRAVFLIQGRLDDVVLHNSANRLYNAAASPKEIWSGMDVRHCEASVKQGPEFVEKLHSLRNTLVWQILQTFDKKCN
jgi:hypothetical protein